MLLLRRQVLTTCYRLCTTQPKFNKMTEVREFRNIVKSANDKRDYLGLQLPNGLKVMLVSDAETDKAAASLAVGIGSLSDPPELPGLAHFLEHMLFLGTEKYPEENAYQKFLSEHGGGANAYTAAELTNYFFDVAPDSLEPALDRFAQFFLSPLFTESATGREVLAVNSENEKNLKSDAWRFNQLLKATCDPTHDFAKFGTGNQQTLETIPTSQGLNVRESLLAFHRRFYSANLMSLSLLGRESVEELKSMAVSKFSNIVNKELTRPEWPVHPMSAEFTQLRVEVVPVRDERLLEVSWPIADYHEHYRAGPCSYVSHLLGHEGAGSLLSELKRRGWVNSLSSGEMAAARGFGFFVCDVTLTEEGLRKVDHILELVFSYLTMLRSAGVQRWVWEESRDLADIKFRFKEKESPQGYVSSLTTKLLNYPEVEGVLTAGRVVDQFKPEVTQNLLDQLTVDTVRVHVIAQQFENSADRTEKWYGTKYSVKPLERELLARLLAAPPLSSLHLPPPNDFIPSDFSLLPATASEPPHPVLVTETPLVRVWHKQDTKFAVPKLSFSADLKSPAAYSSPLHCNLLRLLVTMVTDNLTELSYDASLAGLSYKLEVTNYGLQLKLRGYSEKLESLLVKVAAALVSVEHLQEDRFNIWREEYQRGLENFGMEQPYSHAVYQLSLLLAEVKWSKEELLEALPLTTFPALLRFVPQLFAQLSMETLTYGNCGAETALLLSEVVPAQLRSHVTVGLLSANEQRRFREIQLPRSADGAVFESVNKVHSSNCVEVYYQHGPESTRTNALLELLSQVLHEPCFDVLRTQQQLGYIVFSGLRRSSGVQGLRVLVQSLHSCSDVESRISAFIASVAELVQELSEEEFRNHVEAVATRRLERVKNQREEHDKLWGEIQPQLYQFDRDEREVAALRALSREHLLLFCADLLAESAKLAVHISAGDHQAGADPRLIRDVVAFKHACPLFPLPVPDLAPFRGQSKL